MRKSIIGVMIEEEMTIGDIVEEETPMKMKMRKKVNMKNHK